MKNKELEIKFALRDPKQGHEVFQDKWICDLLVPGSLQEIPMRAIYYDTPDRRLAAGRIGYRVRKEGEDLVATFKWSPAEETAGLARRLEYNLPAKTEAPDLSLFLPLLQEETFPEAEELIPAITGCPEISPLFISDCVRTLGSLSFSESRIELSMDTGELLAGDLHEPVCELECELLEGTEEDLTAFGTELSRRFGLEPLNDSKLKRGLALAEKRIKT